MPIAPREISRSVLNRRLGPCVEDEAFSPSLFRRVHERRLARSAPRKCGRDSPPGNYLPSRVRAFSEHLQGVLVMIVSRRARP